jgi:hypothetical protein
MTKAEIQKLALLAAAKITLVAGAAGCERERAGATRQPVAPTVPPGRAAPVQTASETAQVPTALTAPTTQASQSAPLPGPTAPSAAPERTGLLANPAACVAAADIVRRTGVPSAPVTACCNDLLSRAQAQEPAVLNVAFSCCSVPGVKEARTFCAPWGPPAPPRMPAGWLS